MLDKLALLGFGPGGWGWALLQGAGVTISIALATLPFGLALGLLVALGKRSDSTLLRAVATLYTTIFRGVPELLTLYIIYFGVQLLLQHLWVNLGLPGSFSMPPFVAGMIALGVVLSAFSSEVWVGALNSIQKGQREAAAALGLSKAQAFRLVVLPQLIRVALPGLGNNWMVLLKETSLVSVISAQELLTSVQQIYAMNADGSNQRRISFGDGSYSQPAWSPRGDYIAFTKRRAGGFAIGIMKPDGSGERILTEGFHNESPTWAPNGQYILFFRDPGGQAGGKLYMVDITGRVEQPVPTPSFASDPTWSPLLSEAR